MSLPFVVPQHLARSAAADREMSGWLPGLADRVRDLAARWDLAVGAPYEPGGNTAWVAPARTGGGDEVVLKVGRRHPEAAHEADALRLWDGRGAVRLLRHESSADTLSLLLERCEPGTALTTRPGPEQDEVIAAVLRRTWSTPIDRTPFRPLRELARTWADATAERAAARPGVVRGPLLGAALEVLRERPSPAVGPGDALLCTDLHAGNVLEARREPWLLIDPKPYAGERAYDVVQHLLNCPDRLVADPLGLTARMASLCELDVRAVRAWTFARCLTELWWGPHLLPVVEALAP